jgi:hypothetical protein
MNISIQGIMVLDLLADDYYGLWEVRDYIATLSPELSQDAHLKAGMELLTEFFLAGLVEVFRGRMTGGTFQHVPNAEALDLLNAQQNWVRPPDRFTDVIAVSSTDNAKSLLASTSSPAFR